MKDFNREKAAAAIFRNMAAPVVDGPYVDPQLNTPLSSVGFSVRTSNCLRNDNINLLGDLIQKTEAEILRTPNFGRKGLNEIKAYLAGEGYTLAPHITYGQDNREKPALKESSEETPARPQAQNPLPAIETHDEISTIADQLLPAGAVGYIRLSAKAEAIIKTAKKVFATCEGAHREGDGIAADYRFAIKRLPPQETDKGKTYPVYLSDAALEVLSRPEMLKQFHAGLKTEMTKSATIG